MGLLRDLAPGPGGSDTLNISKLLTQKSDGILKNYLEEVKAVETLFQKYRDNPPLTKNHPPIAGAIYWSESLFRLGATPSGGWSDASLAASLLLSDHFIHPVPTFLSPFCHPLLNGKHFWLFLQLWIF